MHESASCGLDTLLAPSMTAEPVSKYVLIPRARGTKSVIPTPSDTKQSMFRSGYSMRASCTATIDGLFTETAPSMKRSSPRVKSSR